MPADVGGHPALRRVVAVDAGEFADRYWGREPLLSTAEELGPQTSGDSGFVDLFGNDAVDELVSRRGLRTPFLRVARNGSTLPDGAFTAGGGVGAGIADQVSDDRLLQLFAEGSTLVLQGLHRTWPALVDYSQALAAELGHPVQVNAYVTPPQSTGFDDHYDVHDVFVLQVAGQKHWRIRPPVRPSPLRDDPWDGHREQVRAAAARSPLIEAALRPGDALYLPRGYLHAATALGDVSTHLTIGIHPWTRRHLADQLLAAAVRHASQDEPLRASLPFGVDLADSSALGQDVELVRSALLRALAEVDAGELVPALTRQARTSQRAAPVSPVAQLRDAAVLSDVDTLVLREHLLAEIEVTSPERAALTHRGGRLALASGDLDGVRLLLESGSASVAALGVDLARRLVRGGVAVRNPG